MTSIMMFWADDPKPGTPTLFPNFKQIYPIEGRREYQGREITAPVIDVTHVSEPNYLTLIVRLLNDTKIELNATNCRYDDILTRMFLEEEIEKLIASGRIPPNAVVRIH